jgi:hypothetical protein
VGSGWDETEVKIVVDFHPKWNLKSTFLCHLISLSEPVVMKEEILMIN